MNIKFYTEIWKEDGVYISYVPKLDVSSCGDTVEEARKNIKDAVSGFLEGAKKLGTLEQILQEAGFTSGEERKAPEIISFEQAEVSII